jgi:hypothetical protein
MKKLFLTGIILLNIIHLYSQDIIDPPRLFDKSLPNWVAYTGHTIYLPDKFYTGKDFILAWNWGSIGEKLDSALKVNYYHGYAPLQQGQLSDDLDVIDSARIIENLPMAGNGHQTVKIDTRVFGNGLYFIQLQTPTVLENKKLIIIR